MPWDVAAKMIDQWMEDGNANHTSSAWLIFGAHRVSSLLELPCHTE
jgi:hypothetical protein